MPGNYRNVDLYRTTIRLSKANDTRGAVQVGEPGMLVVTHREIARGTPWQCICCSVLTSIAASVVSRLAKAVKTNGYSNYVNDRYVKV